MVKYAFKVRNFNTQYRGVAQAGSALGSGPRGRRFESSHPDVFFRCEEEKVSSKLR
jgi:hypothetical protein